jgi:nitrate reductase NapE component
MPLPGNLPHAVVASGHHAAQIESPEKTGELRTMLWTITIILFILWVVGLVSSYTLGGWIHILLVLAVIVLIFNLLQGRRAL